MGGDHVSTWVTREMALPPRTRRLRSSVREAVQLGSGPFNSSSLSAGESSHAAGGPIPDTQREGCVF